MSDAASGLLGNGVLEAVADVLCRPGGPGVAELGVFYAPLPCAASRTLDAAVLLNAEALGVATWALTPLYRAAVARLRASRRDLRAATAVLVAAPDYATGWAARKAAFAARPAADADAELALSALLLRRDPKCAETWAHRAWVLRIAGARGMDKAGWSAAEGVVAADPVVERELATAAAAAAAKPCNYYAGVHRMRALTRASQRVLLLELARSRHWVEQHVSDCSGWWYHTQTVRRSRELGLFTEGELEKEREFARLIFQASHRETYGSVRMYEAELQRDEPGRHLPPKPK